MNSTGESSLSSLPFSVTVLVDSREKTPLLFPSWINLYTDRTLKVQSVEVRTEVSRMDSGDYAIKGYEGVIAIETKRGLRELHNNVCTKEWKRVCSALSRFSTSCTYPYLVWEITPSELFQKTRYVENPEMVFDRWMQAISAFNLRLMIVGGYHQPGPRRRLGEQLTRMMIAHIQTEGGF